MITQWLNDLERVTDTASLMRLLGDPTRLRLLGLLLPGEQNVTTLCKQLDLAQPTVSHHLGLLRSAKLVKTRRDGKQIFYSLNPKYLTMIPEHGGMHLVHGEMKLCLGVDCAGCTGGPFCMVADDGSRVPIVTGNGES